MFHKQPHKDTANPPGQVGPELTDKQIIEIAQSIRADFLVPWSHTLQFARAIIERVK